MCFLLFLPTFTHLFTVLSQIKRAYIQALILRVCSFSLLFSLLLIGPRTVFITHWAVFITSWGGLPLFCGWFFLTHWVGLPLFCGWFFLTHWVGLPLFCGLLPCHCYVGGFVLTKRGFLCYFIRGLWLFPYFAAEKVSSMRSTSCSLTALYLRWSMPA